MYLKSFVSLPFIRRKYSTNDASKKKVYNEIAFRQVPYIYINPNKLIGTYAKAAGSPAFPSLDASYLLDLEYPLTFTGRIISTLHELLWIMYTDWIAVPWYVSTIMY